jgi:hypothetical protein
MDRSFAPKPRLIMRDLAMIEFLHGSRVLRKSKLSIAPKSSMEAPNFEAAAQKFRSYSLHH